MRQYLRFVGLAAFVFMTSAVANAQSPTTHPDVTLNVGDTAPRLKVSGWFKGAPVDTLVSGKIYVIEFWATWCGPCKKMIPHLTELAKKHVDNATVIGVAVWQHPDENTDASVASLVRPFVQKMGDMMDYSVAADGVDEFMANNWMTAAGQGGIPTAFIIGKDTRIAWIGSPDGLGPILDQVIAGTWDVAMERKRVAADRAANAHRNALIATMMAARKNRDYQKTLASLDQAQAEYPDLAKNSDLISVRLGALIPSNPVAAVSYVKQLTDAGGLVSDKPISVWSILRVVPSDSSDDLLKSAGWKIIADDCKPMVVATVSSDPFFYADYANLLSLAGDVHNAALYLQKAINLESQWMNTHKDEVRPSDLTAHQKHKDRLAQMEASIK
jgi:thiol-disulfide isomerase/thioredoxin